MMRVLKCFRLTPALAIAAAAASLARDSIAGLRPFLSRAANISYNISSNPRWSEYNAPSPGAIVNVATDRDVATTVRFCNKNKIPFLAQNGGHGWISSFSLGSNGVVINLRGLNKVAFNAERTRAFVGGGTLVSEAIGAAYDSNAQLATGNCNCVGMLGAILGGGYGNLMGIYGFGIDTLLSLNYVNADGELLTVTSNMTDLWWALRGAGPNFGIITQAVVEAKYVAQADSKAWVGSLIFTEDKLESVISAIRELTLEPEMNVFLYFAISESKPVVLITPFYYGDQAKARQKFASILSLGPVADTTSITSYTHWNDGAAGFCIKGGRKPTYAADLADLDPQMARAVWNEFIEFTKNPGTEATSVLMESYSLGKGRALPDDSSAFPGRHVNYIVATIPSYSDKRLDPVGEAYGQRVRDIFWSNDGRAFNSTYINYAHGDEALETVYGLSLEQLQSLKQRYDPRNVFDQWFPLLPRSPVSTA